MIPVPGIGLLFRVADPSVLEGSRVSCEFDDSQRVLHACRLVRTHPPTRFEHGKIPRCRSNTAALRIRIPAPFEHPIAFERPCSNTPINTRCIKVTVVVGFVASVAGWLSPLNKPCTPLVPLFAAYPYLKREVP